MLGQTQRAVVAVVSLAGKLRDAALASGQARRVILPLRAAIAVLAPSTQYVTPIHAMMLRWCVAGPSVLTCINALPAESEVNEPPPYRLLTHLALASSERRPAHRFSSYACQHQPLRARHSAGLRASASPLIAALLCSCLVAKAYNAGAELVSQEVYEVDPAVTCLTARDYLLYSYYCALIHIGGWPIQLPDHPRAANPRS